MLAAARTKDDDLGWAFKTPEHVPGVQTSSEFQKFLDFKILDALTASTSYLDVDGQYTTLLGSFSMIPSF